MCKFFTIRGLGLAMVAATIGCSPPATKPPPSPESEQRSAAEATGDHQHGAGPHGGTIIDWGGGAYHVEFTVDHDSKVATVFLLGGDAKSPAPIKADKIHLTIDDPLTELDLAPQPLEGEPAGTASRFSGSHENIGIVKEFSGTISGQIDGTPYTGDFREEPHDAPHED